MHFQREDFFPPGLYKELKDSFPDVGFCTRRSRGKSSFTSESEEGAGFLAQSDCWGKFFEFAQSEAFLQDGFQFAEGALRKSRGLDGRRAWRLYDPEARPNRIRAALDRRLGIAREVKPVLEFSYITGDGVILPHTETPEKLITIMFYFPDNPGDEYDAGTCFYRGNTPDLDSSWTSWKSTPEALYGVDARKKFDKDMHIFLKTRFAENMMAGFIKSNNTWHGIPGMSMPDGEVRKSVNLFIHALDGL